MAKKQRAKPAVKPAKKAAKSQTIVPDYYQKFSCIGPECEDSCCVGWRVDIDHATWNRYKACQHEKLAPLIRTAVIPEEENSRRTNKNYAHIEVLANGRCPFLQPDMLCMIQKELGSGALSDICSMFPRYFNQVGSRREYTLGVACPEAARLVLLHPEPITLIEAASDADLGARDFIHYIDSGDFKQLAVRNDLRAMILYILQFRELTLGARVMLLGSFLDEVNHVVSSPRFKNFAEILPILPSFATLLTEPTFIEAQFEQMPGNILRKLQVTTAFLADFLKHASPRLAECLQAGIDGLLGAEMLVGGDAALLARYHRAYDTYYLPYFREKGYILENYLVNDVLNRLFPFTRGSYLDLYREMVFNLVIVQTFLVGMAGHYQGLTDARVVQLIQSFARKSAHNSSYLGKLTEAIASKDAPSFAGVMWMLKER